MRFEFPGSSAGENVSRTVNAASCVFREYECHRGWFASLTLELTGPERQGRQARPQTMRRAAAAGPGWPAVEGPVQREVRRSLSEGTAYESRAEFRRASLPGHPDGGGKAFRRGCCDGRVQSWRVAMAESSDRLCSCPHPTAGRRQRSEDNGSKRKAVQDVDGTAGA
jgi:hypothetical protein